MLIVEGGEPGVVDGLPGTVVGVFTIGGGGGSDTLDGSSSHPTVQGGTVIFSSAVSFDAPLGEPFAVTTATEVDVVEEVVVDGAIDVEVVDVDCVVMGGVTITLPVAVRHAASSPRVVHCDDPTPCATTEIPLPARHG